MPAKKYSMVTLLALVALRLLQCDTAHAREPAPLPPSQLFGELFHRVQTERLFADSKTFADATAKSSPEEVMRRYAANKGRQGFSLATFVAENFRIPVAATSG